MNGNETVIGQRTYHPSYNSSDDVQKDIKSTTKLVDGKTVTVPPKIKKGDVVTYKVVKNGEEKLVTKIWTGRTFL